MTESIILRLGETAEPDTCGSCKFFNRYAQYYAGGGKCTFALPRWAAEKTYDPEVSHPRELMDYNRCDLYKSAGLSYIISRVVKT